MASSMCSEDGADEGGWSEPPHESDDTDDDMSEALTRRAKRKGMMTQCPGECQGGTRSRDERV